MCLYVIGDISVYNILVYLGDVLCYLSVIIILEGSACRRPCNVIRVGCSGTFADPSIVWEVSDFTNRVCYILFCCVFHMSNGLGVLLPTTCEATTFTSLDFSLFLSVFVFIFLLKDPRIKLDKY